MMRNEKFWILAGSICGFFGVALGAFGAHIMKDSLSPDMMEIYRTGILYHLIHSVVLVSLGFSGKTIYNSAALLFLLGIIFFSGSLYLYSVSEVKIFAMITPLGGVIFLAAWLLLAWKGLKS